MAKGKQTTFEEKLAKLNAQIEELGDKKLAATAKFDARLKALNEEKKTLITEKREKDLDQLRQSILNSGMTIEEAIVKLRK